jgi:RNA ligase (TIGR02306 family)
MAELIVEVCRIADVRPHANADALELSTVKGWQCVVPKGRYQSGDLVTYIPIDAMVPRDLADRWGITNYLSSTGKEPWMGRVRCAKLRGEPSFGVILTPEDETWQEGQDVRDFYGLEKYVPPARFTAGDAAPPHPLFWAYTEIENLRNFPDVIEPGTPVVVTEKIHGTSSRVAMIEGELMAGSMGHRRRQPDTEAEWATNTYWFPLTCPGVRELLENVTRQGARQVVLYGEVYGSKVQNLHYGHAGRLGYRAFDLLVDGKWDDALSFRSMCSAYGVETVPLLWQGPFDLAKIAELSKGQTTLGADHIREGVVVGPAVETTHPKTGRVKLKYIGDQYLFKSAEGKVTDSDDV